jgi:hypothetical protein
LQDEDISVHYRPYASTHGGRAFYAGSAAGSGDDSTHRLRKKSLRRSGSAVLLSDLELEGSYHGCAGPTEMGMLQHNPGVMVCCL